MLDFTIIKPMIRLGLKVWILYLGISMFFMCYFWTLATVMIASSTAKDIVQTEMQTLPLNDLHYIAGSTTLGSGYGQIYEGMAFDGYYYGRDYVRPKGSPIYAPYDGTLTFQENIGGSTPQLAVTSLDGSEVTYFMHMDVIRTSGKIRQGELIATTDSLGAYSNNVPHEHLSYYKNNKLADWEDSGYSYEEKPEEKVFVASTNPNESNMEKLLQIPYGTVVPCSLGTCKVSKYTVNMGFPIQDGVPLAGAGTINCFSDCEYVSSGKSVRELIKSGNCYIAAPSSVSFGTIVEIEGVSCIVVDRGGAIVVNSDGSYWVDVLTN